MASLVSGRDEAGVVIGVADMHTRSDGTKQGVREVLNVAGAERLAGVVAAESGIVHRNRRLIQVDEQAQFVSGGTLIVDFNGKCTAKLALDTEAVLINIRTAKVMVFGSETHQSDPVG